MILPLPAPPATNLFPQISPASHVCRSIRSLPPCSCSSSSSSPSPSPSPPPSSDPATPLYHASRPTLERITRSRIIACVRSHGADTALDMARAALDGGLDVLEVTMTTPGASKAIATLTDEYPTAVIGAGTILSTMDAISAKDAGAKFLMSPITIQNLIETHRCEPTLIIPGAITPNEVFKAFNWGAFLVKLYPVTIMGGLKLVYAIRKSMPSIPLIASQGIDLESVEEYFIAGTSAVVLSDAIFHKALVEAKDFKKIRKRAAIAAEKAVHFSSWSMENSLMVPS